jgi:asparagine synthase (glutamine-hydrolysing)
LREWSERAALRAMPSPARTATAERDFAATLRRAAEEDPMPHLLRFEDRNSMAFSVEARVPFLDHRLFEFVSAEANPFRIREGWTKWLHREAFGANLPPEIAWRRDKVGFATPEHRWLAERAGEIGERFRDGQPVDQLLVTSDIRKRLAEPNFIAQNGSLVWRWLCVAAWSEVFLA